MRREPGCVFYRGPSLLTGEPVVGIATGLDGGSNNPKTGPMIQTYVLRPEILPMDAVRQNIDDAICGDCKLRGRDGFDRKCYVTPFMGPTVVYKSFIAGQYFDVSWPELQAVVEGRGVRLCAYGDPGAVPFEVWRALLRTAATHVGYTHTWKTCDQRLKTICMASVDTIDEFHAAHLADWRTFRVRMAGEELLHIRNIRNSHIKHEIPLEFVCPASDEAGHRTTCEVCRLCRGTSSPARSVAIVVHGKPSSLRAYGLPQRPRRHVESTLDPPWIQPEPTPLLRAKFYRNRTEVRV